MIKRIVFLFAALVAVSSTFAQEQGMKFGIRAGLNLNSGKLDGKDVSDFPNLDNNIGFHIGAVADIGINNFLYFQPGLMLTTKGAEINYEYEEDDDYGYFYEKSTLTIAAYAIEIPLQLSLKWPLSESIFLRANLGPYIGFAISGTVDLEWKYEDEYEGEYDDGSGSYSEDIYPDNGKRFYAGIAMGGGIEYKQFYIGVNYDYGLTNLLDIGGDLEAYDRTLSISLGYNF